MKQSTRLGRFIAPVFNRLPYAGWLLDHLRNWKGQKQILNRWQEGFVQWNAMRLGITREQSLERYRTSMAVFRNGHSGLPFSQFAKKTYDIFGVFVSWNEREAYEAYQFYAPLHFLRMLGYSETQWSGHPLLIALKNKQSVTIGDFGCGLAQHSITLAEHLQNTGKNVQLVLADIPTIRKEFIIWFCNQKKISIEWIDTTEAQPLPRFPDLDVCIATEVFEHLSDPIPFFVAIDQSMRSGSILYTQVKDHGPDPSHFSTDLGALRDKIREHGYQELVQYILYKKEGQSTPTTS